jgi:hypothetical protein
MILHQLITANERARDRRHFQSSLSLSYTGGPRYPPSFYLPIRLFTFKTLVKKSKFLVKMCLFICKFSIRGPKKRDVSTANNEVHL